MPQPIPAEIHTEVAHLRGEFVTNWAMVEMSIDFCIVIIYQLVGGKHIEKEIPRMYSRKIKFLRRCFGRLASLDDFAIEGCALLDRADALMDTRHMLVHGYLSTYTAETDTLLFVKFNVNKDKTMHVGDRLFLTSRQLMDQYIEVDSLNGAFLDFAERVARALMPEGISHQLIRDL